DVARVAVALCVDPDVDGPADLLRRDRARDLLQRDQVLAAAADEQAEILSGDFQAIGLRLLAIADLRLDSHRREDLAQDRRAERELLGVDGRRLFLFTPAGLANSVRATWDLVLVDHVVDIGDELLLE